MTKEANAELRTRGYPKWLISALRKVCGVGLWTQSFVWEEWQLGGSDVLAGYGLLFLFLGVCLGVLGLGFFLPLAKFGALAFVLGLVFIGCAIVGWRLSRLRSK